MTSITLLEFADWLDKQKPSPVQLEVGDQRYNQAVLRTLAWVAAEARKRAKETEHHVTRCNTRD